MPTKESKFFRPNDLDLTYYDFFEDIRDAGQVYADPSGWLDTFVDSSVLLPPVEIDPARFGRYYLDESGSLGEIKTDILKLICAWEQHDLKNSEVTFYSSVSTANGAVLLALKNQGVKTVVFDTPAYGVTVNQARLSGHKVVLVPTYYANNFRFDFEPDKLRSESPIAIWMTQPKMSLGYNQELEHIKILLEKLSSKDFLVIDEATEQRHPPLFAGLVTKKKHPRILRVRGLLKALGLNGLRLSYVVHPKSMQYPLEGVQYFTGASLDLHSLMMTVELAKNTPLFFSMLASANLQIKKLHKKADMLALGAQLKLSPLVNGYMGAAFLPLQGGKKAYALNRKRLLDHCHSHKMPVVLGANMLFAFDPDWEQIRINYFNREQNILRAVEVLAAFPL
ncbi:MAG TPA: aminotransferase class I/II-fold pyridoxal phosphate-dependent enzyme [Pyrinomonadaceae bacterium]|jgi:hypothetical protein|nr:aminotransferase class I/II-fold pyridoxal phosphate-dependent enzyme [Pyrinomonadaceae bacterium]